MPESLHLSHIALGASDPQRLEEFYIDVVGLSLSENLTDGEKRLGWGRGHHAVEIKSGAGLDHFGLEVRSEALARFEDRLTTHGVAYEPLQPPGDHPPALTFEDPDGNRVELHGPVDRCGERAGDPARRPVRLHHVTLASPRVARLASFYVEVLGFRISDQMGDVFTWLRANHEHHTVAVVHGPEAGLDHFAFEIGTWCDLKTWCDELAVRGVPVSWGPGRHGPGNNLFIMFDDPAGHHIELSCDMERFWDDRAAYADPPRRWTVATSTVNLWGIAPPWRQGQVIDQGESNTAGPPRTAVTTHTSTPSRR